MVTRSAFYAIHRDTEMNGRPKRICASSHDWFVNRDTSKAVNLTHPNKFRDDLPRSAKFVEAQERVIAADGSEAECDVFIGRSTFAQ